MLEAKEGEQTTDRFLSSMICFHCWIISETYCSLYLSLSGPTVSAERPGAIIDASTQRQSRFPDWSCGFQWLFLLNKQILFSEADFAESSSDGISSSDERKMILICWDTIHMERSWVGTRSHRWNKVEIFYFFSKNIITHNICERKMTIICMMLWFPPNHWGRNI